MRGLVLKRGSLPSVVGVMLSISVQLQKDMIRLAEAYRPFTESSWPVVRERVVLDYVQDLIAQVDHALWTTGATHVREARYVCWDKFLEGICETEDRETVGAVVAAIHRYERGEVEEVDGELCKLMTVPQCAGVLWLASIAAADYARRQPLDDSIRKAIKLVDNKYQKYRVVLLLAALTHRDLDDHLAAISAKLHSRKNSMLWNLKSSLGHAFYTSDKIARHVKRLQQTYPGFAALTPGPEDIADRCNRVVDALMARRMPAEEKYKLVRRLAAHSSVLRRECVAAAWNPNQPAYPIEIKTHNYSQESRDEIVSMAVDASLTFWRKVIRQMVKRQVPFSKEQLTAIALDLTLAYPMVEDWPSIAYISAGKAMLESGASDAKLCTNLDLWRKAFEIFLFVGSQPEAAETSEDVLKPARQSPSLGLQGPSDETLLGFFCHLRTYGLPKKKLAVAVANNLLIGTPRLEDWLVYIRDVDPTPKDRGVWTKVKERLAGAKSEPIWPVDMAKINAKERASCARPRIDMTASRRPSISSLRSLHDAASSSADPSADLSAIPSNSKVKLERSASQRPVRPRPDNGYEVINGRLAPPHLATRSPGAPVKFARRHTLSNRSTPLFGAM